MEHIASAYGRALYPRRYGRRDDPAQARDPVVPMALAPGGLELDLAGAVYRLVLGAERLMDGLGRRIAARRRPDPRTGTRPVEQG